jgi:hypothetical protein
MAKKVTAAADHTKFVKELWKERSSPRAAAILTLAQIDTVLEKALKAALVDSPPVHALFDGQRALATSAAKIDMAFGLGLISDVTRRDLHKIRQIRNHFAHEVAEGSFDADPARSHIRDMSVFRFADAIMQSARKPAAPTRQFDMMCTMVMAFVEAETRAASRKRPKERAAPPPIPIPSQQELEALRVKGVSRRTRRRNAQEPLQR